MIQVTKWWCSVGWDEASRQPHSAEFMFPWHKPTQFFSPAFYFITSYFITYYYLRRKNMSKFPLCICSLKIFCHFFSIAKLYVTLWDALDCSPPGSSVHGALQVRILEWVAISFSRRSSWSKDWTCISCIDRWILLPTEPPEKP